MGQFTMLGVTLAGAIGNVAGSLVAYYAGVWGGRPFFERYGPYMLVSVRDIEMADRWFAKYGEAAVFFGRMLPVVRTFISLPAGIAGVNIYRFILFTFLGALPWCYLLAYIGVKMGEQWEHLRDYFHQFDIVIGVGLALAIGSSWVALVGAARSQGSALDLTLTGKREPFHSLQPKTVRMYVCGVTHTTIAIRSCSQCQQCSM
jgi:membrane protein DedA with SNARE-associated domain